MIRSLPLSYQEALSFIVEQVRPVATEEALLEETLGRINSCDIRAVIADPRYDQSLRDGFALGVHTAAAVGERAVYTLVGEIPAGRGDTLSVAAGEAYLILTGGLVPRGADRVVMQEDCLVEDGQVLVPLNNLNRTNDFIQRCGSVIEENRLVLPAGSVIDARCVSMLAITGNYRVDLFRKARAAFFCSGSELADRHDSLLPGQKISSNRYLLESLLKNENAVTLDFGTVRDEKHSIAGRFAEITASDADIIISTGGMGPGKYDLLEEVFEEIGGKIYYRSLSMTPGRSTVFGSIGDKVYFGLPGPPSAVSVLFNELIIPGLRKIQGSVSYMLPPVTARLGHDIKVKSADILCIKEGVLYCQGSQNYIRYPKPLEPPNCFMHLEGKCAYSKDELVTAHVNQARSGLRF